jgi:hypothetical protein
MATPPISEPIYCQHERRTNTNLITTELGTDSPTVPWVIWKHNYMLEITRLYRIDESLRPSMTIQIYGADCYLSTRYDSFDRDSPENSLSYVDYISAVCYKHFWVQMGQEHDKLGGGRTGLDYFKENSWHWFGIGGEAKKNKFTLSCSPAKANDVQNQVRLFISLSTSKLMRLEDCSFNSSALKKRTHKPETKTDIQKFADFEPEPKHFQRKPWNRKPGTVISYQSVQISYIQQQMHTIRYKSQVNLRTLLHLSAPRCRPQGIKNYKHQRINLGIKFYYKFSKTYIWFRSYCVHLLVNVTDYKNYRRNV